MNIGGRRVFLPLEDAGITYDNGFLPVEIMGMVLEDDDTVRDITDEERNKIRDIADEHSASK
jgi:hypothetical protein